MLQNEDSQGDPRALPPAPQSTARKSYAIGYGNLAAERRFVTMDRQTPETTVQLGQFLNELTQLSDKYGIGITGVPVLYLFDAEDRGLSYHADDESNLKLT